MHRFIRPLLLSLCACGSAFFLAGCESGSAAGGSSATNAANGDSQPINHLRYDPLRAGDQINITLTPGAVTLQPVITDIKGDGTITLPDIGAIIATNKTPGELEKEIQAKYVPEFFTRMVVTVIPLTRYYYVRGEINTGTGGKQQYTGPVTVTQAISAAGDFSPFAAKNRVQLTRGATGQIIKINCIKAIKHPELDLDVYPGDTIFVPRRFW